MYVLCVWITMTCRYYLHLWICGWPFLSDKLNEFPGCHSELQWFCGMRLGGGEGELEAAGGWVSAISNLHQTVMIKLEWIENTLGTTMGVFFFSEKKHETLLIYIPHTLRGTSLGLQSLHLECCIVRAQRRKASSGLKERIMWQGPQFHSKDSSSQIPQAFCCPCLRCTLTTENVGRMEKDGTVFATCFGWDTWCVNWIPQ